MAQVPLTIDQALQQAIGHHRVGRIQDAERLYRAILQTKPTHPDANHNLGVLTIGVGQATASLSFFKTALEVNPQQGQFWLSYINALIRVGQMDNARQLIAAARKRGLQDEALAKLEAQLPQPVVILPPLLSPTVKRVHREDPLAPATAAREAGRYAEAIVWLEQWLASHPTDASALSLLSHVLLLGKQEDRAAVVIEQAIQIAPTSPAVQRNYARLLLKSQQAPRALQTAQAAYQAEPDNPESSLVLAAALGANLRDADALPLVNQALQARPDYAEAFANRAQLKLRAKDLSGALADAEQALKLKPHLTQLWVLTASLRSKARNVPGAIAALQQALELEPGNVDYMVELGGLLRRNYQVDAAIKLLDKAVTNAPDHASAWTNLGNALHDACLLEKARGAYETAIHLNPEQSEVLHNLGVMAGTAESWGAALAYFDQALKFKPDHPEYLHSKGQALLQLRRPPEEIEKIAQKILSIQPTNEAGLALLGTLCKELSQFAKAAEFFRKIVTITPDSSEANAALGLLLKDINELDEAESYLKRAIELDPGNLNTQSALLYIHNYLARYASTHRLEEARHYGRVASSRVAGKVDAHRDDVVPRSLRIGIVSGDLRKHPVSYFLESFLPHIDGTRVEFIAYPTNTKSDEVTDRLRSYFTAWRPLYGKSDALAAQQIVDDGVHILLDLSGHTNHNRLPLFAWKPAPVQVSWLGYFATTGIEQMDFLLGDPYVTPSAEEANFTESVWRMPESYLCFSPPAASLEVKPLPVLVTGSITFGCFNNLVKMNDTVVAIWARVLRAIPSSRLLLKTWQLADEKQHQRTVERFAVHGIAAKRLVLEGPAPRDELLATYHRVDIALDPFPYPGGTTSAEALWMGVPVLTKRGYCFLSHVGESIAHNADMADWIAYDDEDYVYKAIQLSTNLENLAALRAGMRQRLLSAPLFDAKRFARHFEDAMCGMWQARKRVVTP